MLFQRSRFIGSFELEGAPETAPTGWVRCSGIHAPRCTGCSAATAAPGSPTPTAPPGSRSATNGNGKAERFIQTLKREWAYRRLYRTNQGRLAALPRWVAFYNSRRPHTALGGRPPFSRL